MCIRDREYTESPPDSGIFVPGEVDLDKSPLHQACEWAAGISGENPETNIAEALCDHMFYIFDLDPGPTKVVWSSWSDHWPDYYAEIFKLREFLSDLNHEGDCKDASSYLSVLGKSIGVQIPPVVIEDRIVDNNNPDSYIWTYWWSKYMRCKAGSDYFTIYLGDSENADPPVYKYIPEIGEYCTIMPLIPIHTTWTAHLWGQSGNWVRHQLCFKDGKVYDPLWMVDSEPLFDPLNPGNLAQNLEPALNQRNINQEDLNNTRGVVHDILEALKEGLEENHPGDYQVGNEKVVSKIEWADYKSALIYSDTSNGFVSGQPARTDVHLRIYSGED